MSEDEAKGEVKRDMDYTKLLFHSQIQLIGLYGVLMLFTTAKWWTVFFLISLVMISFISLTAGAHRLWAHQTYIASGWLKFLLMLGHTMAGVGPIFHWVQSHRLHHKYYGTDKDPYNHKKGLMYSYLYSNLLKDHPEKEELVKDIDMRDVDDDAFVWFQRIFYWPMFIIFGLLLPINAPVEYWDESLIISVMILGVLRIVITVQIAWLINSAALIWGLREGQKYPPDDASIFILSKSFWPHYHYLVPWDVDCGEFGSYASDCSSSFIKICFVLGLCSRPVRVKSESIRETLYEIATKRKGTKQGLDDLQAECMLDANETDLRNSR